MTPGERFDVEIRTALLKSKDFIFFISKSTDDAYYQCEEVVWAIELSRHRETKSRIYPVYLDSEIPDIYGFKMLQRINAKDHSVDEIVDILLRSQHDPHQTPSPGDFTSPYSRKNTEEDLQFLIPDLLITDLKAKAPDYVEKITEIVNLLEESARSLERELPHVRCSINGTKRMCQLVNQLSTPELFAKMEADEIASLIISIFLVPFRHIPPYPLVRNIYDPETEIHNEFERFLESNDEKFRYWNQYNRLTDTSEKLSIDEFKKFGDELWSHFFLFWAISHSFSPEKSWVRFWIDHIKQQSSNPDLFSFTNQASFEHDLCLISLSIDQRPDWLRTFLERQTGSRTALKDDNVNVTSVALFLKFIEPLALPWSKVSQLVFAEGSITDRLASTQWEDLVEKTIPKISENRIEVHVKNCTHPLFHKAILNIYSEAKSNEKEIHTELNEQSNNRIPNSFSALIKGSKFSFEVSAKLDPTRRKIYEYQDITFRLEHNAILSLVMGESLYGSPELCLREIIQNSLDALSVRKARFQAKEKDGVHAEVIPSVDIIDINSLQITVTWG